MVWRVLPLCCCIQCANSIPQSFCHLYENLILQSLFLPLLCKLDPKEFSALLCNPTYYMNLLCLHTYLSFTQEGQILCTDFCDFSKRTIAISLVFFEMQEEFKASKQKQPIGFAQGCVVCLWIEAGERSMPTNRKNKKQWRKERDITWMCIQICCSSPSSRTSGGIFQIWCRRQQKGGKPNWIWER